MPTMNDMNTAGQRGLRIAALGRPGTAKTGALAALANAGYKLRILDFDGNTEPLFQYIDKPNWGNVDIAIMEDKLVAGPDGILKPMGVPTAFRNAIKYLSAWKYSEGAGEVDLGSIYDWGNDTVLVVDSGSGVSAAAMNQALALQGRTQLTKIGQDWGVSMAQEMAFYQLITQACINCHVYVTFHTKLMMPDMPGEQSWSKNKPSPTAQQAADDLKIAVANVFPIKWVPNVLGQNNLSVTASHFPIMLYFDTEANGDKVKRVIRTIPAADVDVKVPAKGLPAKLPVETGLLTIFNTLLGNGR